MQPIVMASLVISLVGLFAIFYIFSRHIEVARASVNVGVGHNAVVEPLLIKLEHHAVSLQRSLVSRFYSVAFMILSRLLPLFRRLTRSTEAWLVRTVQMVRGKRELTNLGREAASPYLQDIANNQDAVRKEGGSIE